VRANEQPLAKILGHIYGFWGSAILAAGLRHRVFDYLAEGPALAEEVACRANISVRGSQALLDGLLGLGMIERTSAGYTNSKEMTPYLLSSSRHYMGGYADMILATMPDWSCLPDAVLSGSPQKPQEAPDPANAFWANLVRAIAPVCVPPAKAAARRLGVAEGSGMRMLDVGGGAGAYSATWLDLNPTLRCDQVDWPNVNAIARDCVAGFGHAQRFVTIDGDMETIQLDAEVYDVVIYSNVAHGLPPGRNIEMFRKIKGWLKRGGTLVISCLAPNDDRTGSPILLMFNSNLLLNSESGTIHLLGEYKSWLIQAGFSDVAFEAVEGLPSTLIYGS
jgi:hypothetical protein